MNRSNGPTAITLSTVLLAAQCVSCERHAIAQARQHAAQPAPAPSGTVVQLCDGHTTTRLAPGAPANRATGLAVSADLMAQWQSNHPEREWAAEEDPPHRIEPPADNRAVVVTPDGGAQGAGTQYANYSEYQVAMWQREVSREVEYGDRVFHDADALGGTIGVSCDMCHPNAANTHAETYPKFQVQLGRVALVRDMVNWCLQHPVHAPVMSADDPRMRALEAYIYAQRRGVALNYGQH